jgi:hypothetical protein
MRAAQRAGFDRVFALMRPAWDCRLGPRCSVGSEGRWRRILALAGLPGQLPVATHLPRSSTANSGRSQCTRSGARDHFRSSRLQYHSGSGASQVAALLSCGIFERGGALLGSLGGSAQSSRSAGRSKVDIVDSTVTPHGPEQAS